MLNQRWTPLVRETTLTGCSVSPSPFSFLFHNQKTKAWQRKCHLQNLIRQKPLDMKSGVENTLHLDPKSKQASEQWGIHRACGWLELWHHNLPFKPEGNSVSHDSAVASLRSERCWTWTLGQRREVLKRWGGAEASSSQGDQRGRLLWAPRTAVGCAHICTHKHTWRTHTCPHTHIRLKSTARTNVQHTSLRGKLTTKPLYCSHQVTQSSTLKPHCTMEISYVNHK